MISFTRMIATTNITAGQLKKIARFSKLSCNDIHCCSHSEIYTKAALPN